MGFHLDNCRPLTQTIQNTPVFLSFSVCVRSKKFFKVPIGVNGNSYTFSLKLEALNSGDTCSSETSKYITSNKLYQLLSYKHLFGTRPHSVLCKFVKLRICFSKNCIISVSGKGCDCNSCQ